MMTCLECLAGCPGQVGGEQAQGAGAAAVGRVGHGPKPPHPHSGLLPCSDCRETHDLQTIQEPSRPVAK